MAAFPDTRISLILRLATAADVDAWQEFAAVYGPAIYQLARARGLQPADAEDVTQEILFAVARAVQHFQPDSSQAKFRTWVCRIARNRLADFWQRAARRPLTQAISDSWLESVGQMSADDPPPDSAPPQLCWPGTWKAAPNLTSNSVNIWNIVPIARPTWKP